MKAHAWDDNTLLYTGSRDLREDVLNGGYLPYGENETLDDLPVLKANQTLKRNITANRWEVIPDYRNKVFYDKTTKERLIITKAGVIPANNLTEKEPPIEPWYSFDETAKNWIADLSILKSVIKQKISSDCDNEMKINNVGIESTAIGTKIDCREIDVLRLDQLIALMESKGADDSTQVNYICYDNSIKSVTLADVKAAKIEITEEIMNMLYHKHALYAGIDAIDLAHASIDDITAVKWAWPIN